MKRMQMQILDSFVRVQTFLDRYPNTGPIGYGGARETLDDVVRRLREYSGAQDSGRVLCRGDVRRQRQLVRRIRDRHMRPIVVIAPTQIEPESDVQLPAALRLPHASVGVTRILLACDGMIEAARPFEAVFVAHGMPADFLARFAAARNALAETFDSRAAHVSTHVGARAGLVVQIRRGRTAVARLDAVVRATFDDEVTLAVWRSAKRVHLPSGGRAPGAQLAAEATEEGGQTKRLALAA